MNSADGIPPYTEQTEKQEKRIRSFTEQPSFVEVGEALSLLTSALHTYALYYAIRCNIAEIQRLLYCNIRCISALSMVC